MADSADVAPLAVTKGIGRSSGKTCCDSVSVNSSGFVTQYSLPESLVNTGELCVDSTGQLPVALCCVCFVRGGRPDVYPWEFHDFTPHIHPRSEGGGQAFV